MARSDKTLDFIKKTFPKDAKKGAWLTKTPGIGRLLEYLFFEGLKSDFFAASNNEKIIQRRETPLSCFLSRSGRW